MYADVLQVLVNMMVSLKINLTYLLRVLWTMIVWLEPSTNPRAQAAWISNSDLMALAKRTQDTHDLVNVLANHFISL